MPQTGQPGGRTGLDNNAVNRLAAPPEAESVPTSDRATNASVNTQGYVPDNATHPTPAPSTLENDAGDTTAGPLTFPGGSSNTNRIKSPTNTKVGI